MKRVFLLPAVMVLAIGVNAQAKKPVAKKPASKGVLVGSSALKTNTDSLSYAFGISLGSYMKSQGWQSCNYALLSKAIDNVIKSQPLLLDANEANQLMGKLAETRSKAAAAGEKQKGEAFMAQNKKRQGVMETPSGLQYEILVKGTGPIPTKQDTVTAHYKGTLLNGKEFDNSYTRGEPLTIPVAGVIPGWTEALTMMPVGSKWKLYIPSAIGYGDYGAGQDIPGGATLVFEVELLSIVNKKAQ